ncbi:MAG TPA: hypothetical protein VLB75_06240 [Steroidobacteraceae bacterium]|nr:hypothetical protein [Steroidobacteraceae bacterium]
MQSSILGYARKRYLWAALALCVASSVLYYWHRPAEPPNGGTWLGYTLGTIGALLILWLLVFGVRKRSYRSNLGTVRGWLSAHVYLGIALLLVVTLHSGFQFGWNVHTLAYVLMCVVIASGLFGVVAYLRYPQLMSDNRTSLTREQMIEELAGIDERCVRLANAMPGEFANVIVSNRDRTAIGGSAWALLRGRDDSRVLLPGASAVAGGGGERLVANSAQGAMLDWLGERLSRSSEGELSQQIRELMTLISARRMLLQKLVRDAQIRAWLEIWLYVHVPLSFALLAALIAHVLSVFIYW